MTASEQVLEILHEQVNKSTTVKLISKKWRNDRAGFHDIAKRYVPHGVTQRDVDWGWIWDNWRTPRERGAL